MNNSYIMQTTPLRRKVWSGEEEASRTRGFCEVILKRARLDKPDLVTPAARKRAIVVHTESRGTVKVVFSKHVRVKNGGQ